MESKNQDNIINSKSKRELTQLDEKSATDDQDSLDLNNPNNATTSHHFKLQIVENDTNYVSE